MRKTDFSCEVFPVDPKEKKYNFFVFQKLDVSTIMTA